MRFQMILILERVNVAMDKGDQTVGIIEIVDIMVS